MTSGNQNTCISILEMVLLIKDSAMRLREILGTSPENLDVVSCSSLRMSLNTCFWPFN